MSAIIRKETPIKSREGLWEYLERKPAGKDRICRGRLPIYLRKYVWRFNHRKFSLKEKVKTLFNLIYEQNWSGNQILPKNI